LHIFKVSYNLLPTSFGVIQTNEFFSGQAKNCGRAGVNPDILPSL
jgi:hypothetical protein